MVMMISTMLLISTFLRAMLVGMMARLMLYDGEGDNLNIWRSSWCFELPSKGRLPPDTKRGLLDDLLETKPSSSGGPERGGKTSRTLITSEATWLHGVVEVMGFGQAWGDSLGWIIELALLLWSYLSHPSVAAQHPQWCWQDMESLLRQRWFLHCCHHHRDLHVVYLGSDLFVECQDVIWTYEHTMFLSISCVDLPELSVELVCTPYIYIYIYTYIYIYAFIYTILYI